MYLGSAQFNFASLQLTLSQSWCLVLYSEYYLFCFTSSNLEWMWEGQTVSDLCQGMLSSENTLKRLTSLWTLFIVITRLFHSRVNVGRTNSEWPTSRHVCIREHSYRDWLFSGLSSLLHLFYSLSCILLPIKVSKC